MTAAARIRSQAGYSLLEALAAVFIVALLSGLAVASMPGPADDRETEALAFAAKLERASEEAVATGLFVGAAVDLQGYRFYRRIGASWRETTEHDGFGARAWPEGAVVTVKIEGGRLDQTRLSDIPNAAESAPTVRFDPAGIATPLEVRLAYLDVVYLVRLGVEGEASVEQIDGA